MDGPKPPELVRLTGSHGPVFLHQETVSAIYGDGSNTIVIVTGGVKIEVRESPAEVASLYEQTLSKWWEHHEH